MQKIVKLFFIISVLINFLILNNLSYAQEQHVTKKVAYPISICEKNEIITEALTYYKLKDYLNTIHRLETLLYFEQSLDSELKEILINSLAKQMEFEIANKNYKNAISYNLKILFLNDKFDFNWLNKLLNIYILSQNYRKAHEICLELIKKQNLLYLDNISLSKIYGKLALIYAAFLDTNKSLDSLIQAVKLNKDYKSIMSYVSMIFPKYLKSKFLLDEANEQLSKGKTLEPYILLLIYKELEKENNQLADELIQKILKLDISLKNFKFEKSDLNSKTLIESDEISMAEISKIINSNVTSAVILTNVPSKLKSDNNLNFISEVSEKEFNNSKLSILLMKGDELFKKQKYEDAILEYENAKKYATSLEQKKEIDRKIFSAYWYSKEYYIKITAYAIILIIFLLLIYYYFPFNSNRENSYSLINVSQTLKSGIEAINDQKFQKAINELEKLIDMKLSETETITLYLNLGIAYFHINSFSNALMAFKKVLQYDYENIEAYKYLAKIYVKTKDRSYKAIEVFNFLINHKMADIEMLKIVLSHNLTQGIIDENGVQIATDILTIDKSNELAAKYIIKYFNKVKRIDDEALEFMENYIESYPRDVDIRIIYLETLYRRKEYKKVINECMVLFTYISDNLLIHSLFIDSIVNLKKPQMLVSEYQRLALENPGSKVINFIYQSLHSLIVDKRQEPFVNPELALKVNFSVCSKCFHLNLNDFNNCQRCGCALKL